MSEIQDLYFCQRIAGDAAGTAVGAVLTKHLEEMILHPNKQDHDFCPLKSQKSTKAQYKNPKLSCILLL